MKVLVIGSGGREHALTWKIAKSPKVKKIFCAPGNGGTKDIAENIDIKADDIDSLLNFAKKESIDLTVVGPEVPLTKGIVDKFNKGSLKVFGPCKDLALLEGSKIFAKETMKRFNIPTADFEVFKDASEAKEYIRKKGLPIVIKADGLAAGKGVVVAKTDKEAYEAIDSMLVKKIFGSSGERIIIEDCLEGEEASILIFSDGKNIVPLVSSQDHKRIFDGDKGPNTGGMGAYSPAPVVDDRLFREIIDSIFKPIIEGLNKEGSPYKGVLYGGLMIKNDKLSVLEFNVRFGDPETQAILPRLKSDLVDIMLACIDGKLDKIDVEWDKRSCLAIVASSKGYPGPYEKDKLISGLDKVKEALVFHAGTVSKDGEVFTSGGRVLSVSSVGDTILSANSKAYQEIKKIDFDGIYYRKDIGDKAIKSGNLLR
ncbi:MAG: phosphoribosylamine--glycine ligase [Candidatus Omnitrophota bacterium]